MRADRIGQGIAYMKSYGLRLLLFFICIVIAASILLIRLGSSLPDLGSANVHDIAVTAIGYVIPFIPTLGLAFIVGMQPEGSIRRFAARLTLNIYLVLILLVFTSELEYSTSNAIISIDPPMNAEHISIHVGYDAISMLLMCIPICSTADAALEYVENRHKTTES